MLLSVRLLVWCSDGWHKCFREVQVLFVMAGNCWLIEPFFFFLNRNVEANGTFVTGMLRKGYGMNMKKMRDGNEEC